MRTRQFTVTVGLSCFSVISLYFWINTKGSKVQVITQRTPDIPSSAETHGFMAQNALLDDHVLPSHDKMRNISKIVNVTTPPERPLPPRLNLTNVEIKQMGECVATKDEALLESGKIWSGDIADLRILQHVYLSETSLVVSIGGNVGNDERRLRDMGGSKFIIFEPLPSCFQVLRENFKSAEEKSSALLLNYGIGIENKETRMEKTGTDGEASTLYTKENVTRGEVVQIRNILDLMDDILSRVSTIDLLHVDCEGCELDILEVLVDSGLVVQVTNLQFASHYLIGDAIPYFYERYCRLRELLWRTHELSYDFKFIWENWKRKL